MDQRKEQDQDRTVKDNDKKKDFTSVIQELVIFRTRIRTNITCSMTIVELDVLLPCTLTRQWAVLVSELYKSFSSFWSSPNTAGWFYHFTVVLVFTNSSINPFIYAANYHEFQRAVRLLVARLSTQLSSMSSQVQPQLQTDDIGTNNHQTQRNAATQPWYRSLLTARYA